MDKMICIDPTHNKLTKGKLYTVRKSPTLYDLLVVKDNTGKDYMYGRQRFITIEQWHNNLRSMLINKTK